MTPDNNHVPVSFVDLTKTKVDIGILQAQVSTLTMLCSKMDTVIEKLVDQHDRHLAKVYTDMEKRRIENDADVLKTSMTELMWYWIKYLQLN